MLRAYAYILMLGREGLRHVAETAVLNANYIRARLRSYYQPAVDRICMHECVFSTTDKMAAHGVHALDIAKALLDAGFHPPTIYFPLVVPEAIMIEPTETESKQTLDAFIQAMLDIARLAETDPARVKAAPRTTPVARLDETRAARSLDLASRPAAP